MSKIILSSPSLDTLELARPESIRTVLNKIKDHRNQFIDLTGGDLALIRVRKSKGGYNIEYRHNLNGPHFQSKEALSRRTAEKALISYLRDSSEWNEGIEFTKKRPLPNRIGYAIGRMLRPFASFARGVKIGFENEQKNT